MANLIQVYLKFDGNAREAMTFYKECLGGELHMQTMAEAHMGDGTPETDNRLIHSALTNNTLVLLGSDALTPGDRNIGNNFALALNCTGADDIKDLYAKLSEGGQQTYPLAETFWGATFGQLIDKYGNEWMLNYEHRNG